MPESCNTWIRPRSPDAAQRAALHGVVRRRAGAVTNTGVWYDPGSAKQRFAKSYALHRARETGKGALISDPQFQTATLPRSRGAMRPSFASPSRKVREGDGAAGGARMLARHPL